MLSFLDLPTEVRFMVYELLADHRPQVNFKIFKDQIYDQEREVYTHLGVEIRPRPKSPSCLRISKQIAEEIKLSIVTKARAVIRFTTADVPLHQFDPYEDELPAEEHPALFGTAERQEIDEDWDEEGVRASFYSSITQDVPKWLIDGIKVVAICSDDMDPTLQVKEFYKEGIVMRDEQQERVDRVKQAFPKLQKLSFTLSIDIMETAWSVQLDIDDLGCLHKAAPVSPQENVKYESSVTLKMEDKPLDQNSFVLHQLPLKWRLEPSVNKKYYFKIKTTDKPGAWKGVVFEHMGLEELNPLGLE